MNVFLTGATGYIGGTVADRLVAAGHRVRGLVRTAERADALRKIDVEPVIGALDDTTLLQREAARADGVVSTANADDTATVDTFIAALAGTDKPFVHTSGSSVIGDDARGNSVRDTIFDEDSPFVVLPLKQPRRDIELRVQAAAGRGVRSVMICPTNIYGMGRGLNRHSIQIPMLVEHARKHGAVQVVGKGVNRWSTVHIEDVADLYVLALDRAPAGAYYFAENGEASFAEIGAAIAKRLGLGPVEGLPVEEAARLWGEARAYFSLGSNSRVRAKRARRELDWSPRHTSVTDWILNEMPL